MKGNLIDKLRVSGGYWKEQRRRYLKQIFLHSLRTKKELEEMEKIETEKFEELEQFGLKKTIEEPIDEPIEEPTEEAFEKTT
jgi:bifunctional DNA-binding transcriptional regulator/antitoxin component of YhaV-PrlF toxin-antitoxin module